MLSYVCLEVVYVIEAFWWAWKLEPQSWDKFRNIIGSKLFLGRLNLRKEKSVSPNHAFILAMQVTKAFLSYF